MTDLLDTPTMRQLDTGSLVTLKQRIERELMRRGDVEQAVLTEAERMAYDCIAAGCTPDEVRIALERGKQSQSAANTPTPLTQRQLLREPDPECTRCWGRGIKLTSELTTTGFVTELCPCLWGGG